MIAGRSEEGEAHPLGNYIKSLGELDSLILMIMSSRTDVEEFFKWEMEEVDDIKGLGEVEFNWWGWPQCMEPCIRSELDSSSASCEARL